MEPLIILHSGAKCRLQDAGIPECPPVILTGADTLQLNPESTILLIADETAKQMEISVIQDLSGSTTNGILGVSYASTIHSDPGL